ncbi:MAG TPA: type I-C CRISPR-associated protein Cas5c [Kofleriaceae bacterium]|nr:type I-C CRISPR-associated protein Cas5c [Kofleriaceae bacterium]
MRRSRTFRVQVSGPLAVFTRPEMKVERVSYEVLTPSAARGVLEAILWRPAVRWVVEEIAVLREIRWTSFRRNEVSSRMPSRPRLPYFADDDRTQRNTVALRDVAYVVSAHLSLTGRAGAGDNVAKFEEMFARRLSRGQTFHQPYLGCREMAADVGPATGGRPPIRLSKPLGLVFWDFDYRSRPPRPLFFEAALDRGVLRVPSEDEVRRANDPVEARS